jgi:hypothetical protein
MRLVEHSGGRAARQCSAVQRRAQQSSRHQPIRRAARSTRPASINASACPAHTSAGGGGAAKPLLGKRVQGIAGTFAGLGAQTTGKKTGGRWICCCLGRVCILETHFLSSDTWPASQKAGGCSVLSVAGQASLEALVGIFVMRAGTVIVARRVLFALSVSCLAWLSAWPARARCRLATRPR